MAKKDKEPPVPPAFLNPRVVIFGEIVVDEHTKCVFEPWMDRTHNVIGWDARPTNVKKRAFIYISPDIDSGAAEPRFFLYIGPHGDPTKDRRLGPYNLKGDDTS